MNVPTGVQSIKQRFADFVGAVAHCEAKAMHLIPRHQVDGFFTPMLMEIEIDNMTGTYRRKRTTQTIEKAWHKPRLSAARRWLAAGVLVGEMPVTRWDCAWFHIGLDSVELTYPDFANVKYAVNPFYDPSGNLPRFCQSSVVNRNLPGTPSPTYATADLVLGWEAYLREAAELCAIMEQHASCELFVPSRDLKALFERWINIVDPAELRHQKQG